MATGGIAALTLENVGRLLVLSGAFAGTLAGFVSRIDESYRTRKMEATAYAISVAEFPCKGWPSNAPDDSKDDESFSLRP